MRVLLTSLALCMGCLDFSPGKFAFPCEETSCDGETNSDGGLFANVGLDAGGGGSNGAAESWVLQERVLSADAGTDFGFSVALSADGTTLAVGSPLEMLNGRQKSGWVRLYSGSTGVWSEPRNFNYDDGDCCNRFGYSVALSGDGNVLAVGLPSNDRSNNDEQKAKGGVFRYQRNQQEFPANPNVPILGAYTQGRLGSSVSLNADGGVLLVGYLYDSQSESGGRPAVYKSGPSTHSSIERLSCDGAAGRSIDIRQGGNRWSAAFDCASDPSRSGVSWGKLTASSLTSQNTKTVVTTPYSAVALSMNGEFLAYQKADSGLCVSSLRESNEPEACVDPLVSEQLGKVASLALNMDGSLIVVGDVENSRVLVASRSNGVWSHQKIDAPPTSLGQKFGHSVSVNFAGNLIVVGDPMAAKVYTYKKTH